MPLIANQSFVFTPRESLIKKLADSVANKSIYMILLSGIRTSDTASVWDTIASGDTRSVLEQVTKKDILPYELKSTNGYTRSLLTFGEAYWDVASDTAKLPRTQGSFTLTADGIGYDGVALLEGATLKSSAVISNIDATANTLTSATHGLSNGDEVMIGGDVLPGGVNGAVLYKAINVTTNTFQISVDGIAVVDITSAGTNPFFRYAKGNLGSPILIAPSLSSLYAGVAHNIPLDISEADMN
ncbi:MAG: hypothetical protein ACRCT1_15455, partial [Microcoleaceae cyanobacterium]